MELHLWLLFLVILLFFLRHFVIVIAFLHLDFCSIFRSREHRHSRSTSFDVFGVGRLDALHIEAEDRVDLGISSQPSSSKMRRKERKKE
jgi:hypothetical protein